MCWIPLFVFENATPIDKQRHFLFHTKDNTFADSTGYQYCIIAPDGFGHFANTFHPKSVDDNFKEANAEFYRHADGTMYICSKKFIKAGEEILCDYHSSIAVRRPSDSNDTIDLGKSCSCRECLLARIQQDDEQLNLKKRKLRTKAEMAWPSASSEVYQHLMAKFFDATSPISSQAVILHGVSPEDRRFNILKNPGDKFAGAGLTERSWRNLLETLLKALQ